MKDGNYWLQVGPEEDCIYVDLSEGASDCEDPNMQLDFYNLCHSDETAWMFGDKRFIEDLGLTSNNWGWSMYLGDLVEGQGSEVDPIYTKPIYAGAAQGDITKGYLVGYVDIFWDGEEVTWEFDFEDDVVVDPMVWVGNDPLPIFR